MNIIVKTAAMILNILFLEMINPKPALPVIAAK